MDYHIVISIVSLVCCHFIELGQTLLSVYTRSRWLQLWKLDRPFLAIHTALSGSLLIAFSRSFRALLVFYGWVLSTAVFPWPVGYMHI